MWAFQCWHWKSLHKSQQGGYSELDLVQPLPQFLLIPNCLIFYAPLLWLLYSGFLNCTPWVPACKSQFLPGFPQRIYFAPCVNEVSSFPEDLRSHTFHCTDFNHVFGFLASLFFLSLPFNLCCNQQICSLVLSRIFLPLKVLGGRGPTFYSMGYTKKFSQERWVSSKGNSLPSYLENKVVSITLHNEEYFMQTWVKNFDLILELLSYLPFFSFQDLVRCDTTPNYTMPFFLLSWSLSIGIKLSAVFNCLLVLGTSWNFP